MLPSTPDECENAFFSPFQFLSRFHSTSLSPRQRGFLHFLCRHGKISNVLRPCKLPPCNDVSPYKNENEMQDLCPGYHAPLFSRELSGDASVELDVSKCLC